MWSWWAEDQGPGGGRRVGCQVEEDRVTLPPSQQESSQGELVADEDQDPLVSGGGADCRLLGTGSVCE